MGSSLFPDIQNRDMEEISNINVHGVSGSYFLGVGTVTVQLLLGCQCGNAMSAQSCLLGQRQSQ